MIITDPQNKFVFWLEKIFEETNFEWQMEMAQGTVLYGLPNWTFVGWIEQEKFKDPGPVLHKYCFI